VSRHAGQARPTGGPIQCQAEEEELLQSKALQRQAEEALQGKALQR
jgi:hypothetical protein